MGSIKSALLIFIMFIISVYSFGQVNIEKYRLLKNKDGTSLDMSVSTTLIRGNSDIVNIDAGAGIYHKKGKIQLFLKGMLSFGEKKDDKYINKGFIHLRGIRELSTRLSTEAFLQAEYNEFILLKSRKLGGSGIRYKIYESERISLFIGSGIMYEDENFSERDGIILKENTKYIKSTNYLSLNWKISKTASLGLVTYYQTRFSRFSDYRLLSNINLQLRISGNLSFVSTINHRYDNSPPLTIVKYDLSVKSGINLSI